MLHNKLIMLAMQNWCKTSKYVEDMLRKTKSNSDMFVLGAPTEVHLLHLWPVPSHFSTRWTFFGFKNQDLENKIWKKYFLNLHHTADRMALFSSKTGETSHFYVEKTGKCQKRCGPPNTIKIIKLILGYVSLSYCITVVRNSYSVRHPLT